MYGYDWAAIPHAQHEEGSGSPGAQDTVRQESISVSNEMDLRTRTQLGCASRAGCQSRSQRGQGYRRAIYDGDPVQRIDGGHYHRYVPKRTDARWSQQTNWRQSWRKFRWRILRIIKIGWSEIGPIKNRYPTPAPDAFDRFLKD